MKAYTTDIAARYVSEKYDGVQGIWDGKELVTRTGGKINAPGWWTAALPDKELVGELWIGRGRFEAVKSIVQSTRPDGWNQVRFMVFYGADPGESLGTFASPVPEIPVTGPGHLEAFYNDVITHGGEGIVVKDPQGDLFKRKPVQDDDGDDGEVLGYTDGKGKYQGMTGALVLKLRSGRKLKLSAGLSDDLRQSPPAT